MANSFVLRIRRESKGPIGALVVVWSVVQAVAMMEYLIHLQSHSARAGWFWLWFWSNVFLGVAIGVRRRPGAVIGAPMLAGVVAVLPTVTGFLAMHGVSLWKGLLFAALYYLLFGWLVYAVAQSLILGVSAGVVRVLTRPFRRETEIEIFGPDGRPI